MFSNEKHSLKTLSAILRKTGFWQRKINFSSTFVGKASICSLQYGKVFRDSRKVFPTVLKTSKMTIYSFQFIISRTINHCTSLHLSSQTIRFDTTKENKTKK